MGAAAPLVGQLEVLAAVAAYTSRPEQLKGRDVIHFIDNTPALSLASPKGIAPTLTLPGLPD